MTHMDDDAPNQERWMELAALVKRQGGLLATTVSAARDVDVHPDLAVAAVQEGHDVHYAGAGAVIAPDDADLGLLAGDALYALGLEQLAERGDLLAIRLLADVISACAQVHAEGRPEEADVLWEDAARQLDPTGRSHDSWSPFS
jgi:hypothetical protein